MSDPVMPRPMVLEEFVPHLDAAFTVACDPCDVPLTLVEAYPLKDHARLDRPPFMLIFHSAPNAFLVEGLYVLRSGTLGPAPVHLSPVAAHPGNAPGHYYQALFN